MIIVYVVTLKTITRENISIEAIVLETLETNGHLLRVLPT